MKYCPAGEMLEDQYKKLLQGHLLKTFSSAIINIEVSILDAEMSWNSDTLSA